MPYKRRGSPYYQVAPSLRRYGRIGPFSSGSRNRKTAEQMHLWLQELELESPELIEFLLEKRFTLPQLWIARKQGRLEELRSLTSDPPLSDAISEVLSLESDARLRPSYQTLLGYAPPKARLSWLADSKQLSHVYARAIAEGQKPATVRRGLHRVVSAILCHFYGKEGRTRILSSVRLPRVRDERRVVVTPEQIHRLLVEAHRLDPLLADYVVVAILTAVDQAPLLRLTPEHLDLERGLLRVVDSKARQRQRVVALAGPALDVLARLSAERSSGEKLFPWGKDRLDYIWNRAKAQAAGVRPRHRNPWKDKRRSEAGEVTLDRLRIKDLRHILPSMWVALGYSLKDLQGIMGHTQISTTGRYLTEQVAGDRSRLNTVASHLGLGPHLKLL